MEENLAKKLRGELTQKELAERLGISQIAVSHFEKKENPTLKTLEKIAAAVGKKIVISIEDLESKEENQNLCLYLGHGERLDKR